jgi:shikimate kinase
LGLFAGDRGLGSAGFDRAAAERVRELIALTGGGAFVNDETRSLIKARALSVWLKADLELLARRIGRKDTRPLVRGKDPLEVLTALAEVRYPTYAQADIVVETGDTPHQEAVEAILDALQTHLAGAEA